MPDVSNPPGLAESGDVDHDETSNRTHDGDDLSPATLEADAATIANRQISNVLGAHDVQIEELLLNQGLDSLDFGGGFVEIYANQDRIDSSTNIEGFNGSISLIDGQTTGSLTTTYETLDFVPESVVVNQTADVRQDVVAENGERFEYDSPQEPSPTLKITGSDNVITNSTSKTVNVSSSSSYTFSGTKTPESQSLIIQGIREIISDSKSGQNVSDGETVNVNISGVADPKNASIKFIGPGETTKTNTLAGAFGTDLNSDGTKVSYNITEKPINNTVTTNIEPSNDAVGGDCAGTATVKVESSVDSYTATIDISDSDDTVTKDLEVSGQGDTIDNYIISTNNVSCGSNNLLRTRRPYKYDYIDTLQTEDPAVSINGTSYQHTGTISGNEEVTKTVTLSKGTNELVFSYNSGSSPDYSLEYDRVEATKSPDVTINGVVYSATGYVDNDENKTFDISEVNLGTNNVGLATTGDVEKANIELEVDEITESVDPSVQINSDNGSQTVNHAGTLNDGETVDLSNDIDESLIGGTVTVSVAVSDSVTEPVGQIGFEYLDEGMDAGGIIKYQIEDRDGNSKRLPIDTLTDISSFTSKDVRLIIEFFSGFADLTSSGYGIYFDGGN